MYLEECKIRWIGLWFVYLSIEVTWAWWAGIVWYLMGTWSLWWRLESLWRIFGLWWELSSWNGDHRRNYGWARIRHWKWDCWLRCWDRAGFGRWWWTVCCWIGIAGPPSSLCLRWTAILIAMKCPFPCWTSRSWTRSGYTPCYTLSAVPPIAHILSHYNSAKSADCISRSAQSPPNQLHSRPCSRCILCCSRISLLCSHYISTGKTYSLYILCLDYPSVYYTPSYNHSM